MLGKSSTRRKVALAPVSWALACDLRSTLEGIRFLKWPAEGLTRYEQKRLGILLGHIEAAQDEVQRLQRSLSERSKLEGEERPNYQVARNMNRSN